MSDDKKLEGALANLGNEYSPPAGWQDRVFAQIADEDVDALLARAKAGYPSDSDIRAFAEHASSHNCVHGGEADYLIAWRALGNDVPGIIGLMPQSMARGLVALAIEQEREKGEPK